MNPEKKRKWHRRDKVNRTLSSLCWRMRQITNMGGGIKMVANMEYDELYKAILRPGREMETRIETEKEISQISPVFWCPCERWKQSGPLSRWEGSRCREETAVTTEWVEKSLSACFIISSLTIRKTFIKLGCAKCANRAWSLAHPLH